MLPKNIAKVLLGSASPPQIILACVLGSMLGFMPGFAQAAGTIVGLSLLLLIFNCNLGLAAAVGLLSKLCSLLLMPLTFAVGRLLLDGPTQGLFATLINAPVLALFGFEYYVTTGGLVLGALTGGLLGLGLSRTVTGIRSRLARAEADSGTFNAVLENRATRLLIRLLLGGVPTSGYAELLNPKSAPIRISGVAVALALVAAVYAGFLALDGPLAADWLRSALQKANGATVDIGSAELDLEAGAFSVTGLAIADPNALGTDLFRAQRITMDISAADLLRKRVHIDKIEIDGGAHGLARTTPGQLIGPPPEPKPTPETGSEKDLDDYLAQAGDWKKRMSQIKTWLDAVSRSGAGDLFTRLREGDSEDGSSEEPEAMTLDEWLDREIQAQGYVHVRAHHLIQGAPTLQVDWIHAPNTTTTLLGGETLDIQARHLSTQPHLVAQGPTLSVQSKDKSIDLALVLDGASARGGANRVKIALSNLPTDELAGQLSANPGTVSGGTVDILVEGQIEDKGGAWLDLPVAVTVRNTTVKFSGQNLPIDRLEVPVRVRGPLDNLSLIVNEQAIFASLSKAAGGVLQGKAKALVTQELDKATGGLMKQAEGEAGGLLKGLGGKKGIGGLFGQ